MNRISSDNYAINNSLPFQLNIFLANFFRFLGVLVVTTSSLPLFIISLLPLSAIYYQIQVFKFLLLLKL